MSRTVLATATFFDPGAIAFLEAHNCKVVLSGLPPGTPDTSLTKERVFELLRDVDAWIVATAPVTREMLASFPKLSVIANERLDGCQVLAISKLSFGRAAASKAPAAARSVLPHRRR